MPKSKSKSKSEQAQVQGEVVTGHIELNGQGSKPSHKSVVKPGKFVNYVPGSYKKALLRSMAQQSVSTSGNSSKSTAFKVKKTPKERSNSVVSPPKVYKYSSEKPGK